MLVGWTHDTRALYALSLFLKGQRVVRTLSYSARIVHGLPVAMLYIAR